jgi:phosphonate transport system substrate-binding protein
MTDALIDQYSSLDNGKPVTSCPPQAASFLRQVSVFCSTTISILLLSTLLSLLPTLTTHASENFPNSYRLGIFPYMAPRQTIKYYGPVAADMERVLKRPVRLESQRSFTDFTRAIALHAYEIALIQPFDYPAVVEKEGYIPLARLSVPLVTQFYVRDDSPYHKLQDLKGTTIAMPPAKAANSRMALRALQNNHLVPGRDIKIHYFNSHDSCLQQVWVGNASACTSAPPPAKVFEKRMQARLRSIYNTPPIPHVLFVADPRVPAADRAKLVQLITSWNQQAHGRKMLKDLGFPPFVQIKSGEYAMMRHYETQIPPAAISAGNNQNITLGIFPYLSSRQLAKNFAPLLPALTLAAGMPVSLRTASNFGSFSDNLVAGKYDIVLVQPFEFERAVHLGYIPLAGMKDLIYGGFYVRKDSPYRRIVDFKGKTIVMAPVESAQSRLGRHALVKAGLDPKHDVKILYVNTHDSCLRKVQLRTAAACVTSPLILKMIPKDFAAGLRRVGETEKMPGVVFLANQRLSRPVQIKLQQEILSWDHTRKGRKILDSMQFGSFVPVNLKTYQNISGIGR